MKVFSYIALSITLALAFVTWLPGRYAWTIIMYSSFLLPFLLIADVAAIVYLIRHWKGKGAKWLAALLVAIPIVGAIGLYAPWNTVTDHTMSKHFHRHEKELRELVAYAESLSDSTSLTFPSDPIPDNVPDRAYYHTLELLGRSDCESIQTYSVFDNATRVTYRTVVFTAHGYIFYPDGTVKIFRWDPLGSDISGMYDILP